MKLSTRTRYGTRAMLDIALNQEAGPVNAREIAQHQELSAKYLEQLMSALQGAGLVRGVRGPRGGYVLTRPASQISVREIFEALEGVDGLVDCTAHPEVCEPSAKCVMQEVWAQMYAACVEILESTMLADLVRRSREKQLSLPNMYCI